MSKKAKVTEQLSVGSRVSHSNSKNLDAGVVVWKHTKTNVINKRLKDGAEWSVHWTDGNRGIYTTSDIQLIQPRKTNIIIIKDIIKGSNEG